MADISHLNQELRLETVWRTVNMIPPGKVSTYGEIAEFAGMKGRARYTGYALSQLAEGSAVPWHRVVNSQGKISFPSTSARFHEQQRRLQEDGVAVFAGKVSLKRYRWEP